MTEIIIDDNGYPLMLANVPGSGVLVRSKTNQTKGNKFHDARSGKFGSGPSSQSRQPKTIDKTRIADSEQLQRYYDSVRDIARKFQHIDEGDVRKFLEGRVSDINQVDLNQFMQKAREQRMNDVVDVLSTDISSGSRKEVRIKAPKKFVNESFRGLSDDEIVSIAKRIEARGNDHDTVISSIIDKISDPDRKAKIQGSL